jgi:signal transduction histidine kinase
LLAFEAVLGPLGYRIVGAGSGEEALERLPREDFVVILMDVHMPGLDGYQTTALIRQRPDSRDVPIIFVTAVYDQPEHTHRGYALGAVDYITKPFDPEVLRWKVGALVKLYMRGLRAERERRRDADRMKDLFLGAVGHDLRGPLNVIVMAAQLLREDNFENLAQRNYVERIERAGHRMQRMIDDILDLTLGQFAGGIPLTPQSMNLGDVSRTVVDEYRLVRPDRPIELDVSGDVRGYWDRGRIERVVSNLVDNAVKHGRERPVRVRVRDEGPCVKMEVWNEGAPIEPEMQSKVFDPFRRGDDGTPGLGLGLYIVREIVRAHAGTVELRSTTQDGTTFTVGLPGVRGVERQRLPYGRGGEA